MRFFNDNRYVTVSFCDSARSYLIVILFCMSIMIREVGNLFTDLLVIYLPWRNAYSSLLFLIYMLPALKLKKAPHSSTLAWKIPRMEEPSRLQSMGSLRVVHD